MILARIASQGTGNFAAMAGYVLPESIVPVPLLVAAQMNRLLAARIVVVLREMSARKKVLLAFLAADIGAMAKPVLLDIIAQQTAYRFVCLLPRITAVEEECARQEYARQMADVVRLDCHNDAAAYVVLKTTSVL